MVQLTGGRLSRKCGLNVGKTTDKFLRGNNTGSANIFSSSVHIHVMVTETLRVNSTGPLNREPQSGSGVLLFVFSLSDLKFKSS